MTDTRPTVYLAGPAVFLAASAAIFRYLKEVCAEQGLEGVAPVEETGYLKHLPKAEQAAAIRQGNIGRIKECDMVIACVTAFRGPGADAGTAWEMGYAEALGKPVIPWTEETAPYLERVIHDKDPDGSVWCKQHGMMVEDFGLADNLMLAAGPVPVQPDFQSAVMVAAEIWRQKTAVRP
ncbi:nucleoside 2-deoxyribosyltransferase [Telmatospirillum sp. J64-1]|uniref:nucleoside 2-deoxyribosyltransferase n=1 Tax=Telmatospirillum sp. J64-1 TaxID=2502183 RepID=UPI00115E8C23|nr:nucleoside 2-deoxyribosyltransferase [Telmatospirillum sp. J64-1]